MGWGLLKKKALVVRLPEEFLVAEIRGQSVASFSFRDKGSDVDKFRLERPLL